MIKLERRPQTLANHLRFEPLYHFVLLPILLLHLVAQGIQLLTSFSFLALCTFLMAVGLILLFFYARLFALWAQDRVIRLEMRLRLAEVLPEELVARVPELALGQLIALRFASDEEMPELVRQVLDEGIRDQQAIKRRIRTWNPDTCRV